MGNAEKFYIRGTDGNAGLGTSSPATHLEVSGPGFQKVRITSTNGGGCALELAHTGTRPWQISGGGVVSFDYGTDLSTFLNNTIDINASTAVLEPYNDNTYGLGTSAYRWTSVYAVNGTIQTSDARLKKNIENVQYG